MGDDVFLEASVDLYWLPLGAGAPSGSRSVRVDGKVFEAVQATLERRPRYELYHAGLEVRLDSALFVIEVAPSPDAVGAQRGVVAEGAVGSRLARHFRLFRYELRCWAEGSIPDIDEAVASPIRLSDDPRAARRLLELVPSVPRNVWGRDEARAGEMWTSNSVISWLIVRTGLAVERVPLPAGGRAPGWDAGLVSAARPHGPCRTPGSDSGCGFSARSSAPPPIAGTGTGVTMSCKAKGACHERDRHWIRRVGVR